MFAISERLSVCGERMNAGFVRRCASLCKCGLLPGNNLTSALLNGPFPDKLTVTYTRLSKLWSVCVNRSGSCVPWKRSVSILSLSSSFTLLLCKLTERLWLADGV